MNLSQSVQVSLGDMYIRHAYLYGTLLTRMESQKFPHVAVLGDLLRMNGNQFRIVYIFSLLCVLTKRSFVCTDMARRLPSLEHVAERSVRDRTAGG